MLLYQLVFIYYSSFRKTYFDTNPHELHTNIHKLFMGKKEKTQLIITVFLIFALVFFVINAIKRVEKHKRRPARPGTSKKAAVMEPVKKQPVDTVKQSVSGRELLRALEEETGKLAAERDPFNAIPVVIPSKAYPHGLILKGIAWDDKNPKTIINDTILSKGDKIGDSLIISIEPDRVILNDGAADFELHLDIEQK